MNNTITQLQRLSELCMQSYTTNMPTQSYEYPLLNTIAVHDYKALICKDDEHRQIIICIRGTDNVGGIMNDVEMLAGILPSWIKYTDMSYQSALTYADEMQYDIIVTGHSLGGSFGQYCTYKYGIKSVNYNPYGIIQCMHIKELSQRTQNLCTNYVIADDVVSSSSMQWQLGNTIRWDLPDEEVLRNMSIVQMIEYRHAITTIIKLLQGMQ